MRDLDEMGPVDYIVVEFPGGKLRGEGLTLLMDLVDHGVIRVVDLAFVRKDADGSVVAVAIRDLDGDGQFDLSVFEGASSGILGSDDIENSGRTLQPGSTAVLLVYENLWAAPLAVTLRRAGAQLVATGRIPVQGILAALDELDATESRGAGGSPATEPAAGGSPAAAGGGTGAHPGTADEPAAARRG